ncbi:MAG: acyl-CoA dehydratase activase [Clostridiales Family XIII bacterium]|jgi:predicted CoA-substrate-specific enzyme activase|nr:acyl-CoA dehydratase activase [Clostridiales Family XIII bacterium]
MFLGVDIGSSSSKAVVVDAKRKVLGEHIVNRGTGSDGPEISVNVALEMAGLRREDIRRCVATGYGRMRYEGADKQITEISCHAKGVYFLAPAARTIIDVGGQDAKVIRVAEGGMVENFVMNEKCAAGTGRFLEVMTRVLGCGIDELSGLAARGRDGVDISNTCTVFAESEVISRLASGASREDVALGAHVSVAQRIAGLCARTGLADAVVMTGGVALNDSVVSAIEREIGRPIVRLYDPQGAGALGAAIFAAEAEDAR